MDDADVRDAIDKAVDRGINQLQKVIEAQFVNERAARTHGQNEMRTALQLALAPYQPLPAQVASNTATNTETTKRLDGVRNVLVGLTVGVGLNFVSLLPELAAVLKSVL